MRQDRKFVAMVVENLPEVPEDVKQGWIENPKGLQKFLSGLCPPAEAFAQAQLLRKLTTVVVSGAKKFVAKDHLRDANVGWMGDSFKRLFLGNVEENVEAITVAIHRLEKSSLDAPIMAQLANRTEINLAHFFELLKKQSKGEDGVLLTNGHANIAYIKGSDGNFWTVRAYWDSSSRYWVVEAYSVEYPGRWHDGRQVLSRDS